MGTQWWRDWLTWGLGGGGEVGRPGAANASLRATDCFVLVRGGQLGDRWLSSAWLRFTRDVGIASICRGVNDADSGFLTNWEWFRGLAGGVYVRVAYLDRFSGCDTVGMGEGRLDARQQAGEYWMGTQWWRDWLTRGLGSGGEIPSSVVGLWGVWKVAPALFTCVKVCVCEAVALQRGTVLHEFCRPWTGFSDAGSRFLTNWESFVGIINATVDLNVGKHEGVCSSIQKKRMPERLIGRE
ncbi:uncharacterized protein EMH_0028710 [Eimeria mitis]|uniref:Uncharacterized protein n=1 Tax=Eimeria mitis TaxID=44415 RepID=U6JSM3_9EIME|nr:uncharacterized protein EMH_0028710 [Eimeria mitis]CDJ27062.1 hypothetical protein EMH_0028710 [Eimeria mitis]